jgi:hypothetical protein
VVSDVACPPMLRKSKHFRRVPETRSFRIANRYSLSLQGEGELVEVDLEAAFGKEREGKMTKVWRCKEEGWKEERGSYLRDDAQTI